MNEVKKIARLVATIFYVMIVLFFLCGADFPPPIGFLYLVAILLVIAFVVYQFSKWLTPKLITKENVKITVVRYYLIFGSLLGFLACLVPSGEPSLNRDLILGERLFLFIVVILLTFIWGIFIYVINYILVKLKRRD